MQTEDQQHIQSDQKQKGMTLADVYKAVLRQGVHSSAEFLKLYEESKSK